MLEEREQYEIALAALLCDIGRFRQRARHSQDAQDNTRAFLAEELIPSLNKVLKESVNWDFVVYAATGGSQVVLQARELASGNSGLKADKLDNLYRPQKPVFTGAGLKKRDPSGTKFMYPLCKIDQTGLAMIPTEEKQLSVQDYKEHYQGFIEEAQAAGRACSSLETFLLKLKDLMSKYTWCVPYVTDDINRDISLYDHSLMTLAFALVLANSENEGKPFRLCAMGVSGIQNFIFGTRDASFKEAAKLFRGRSFLVSVMPAVYKRYIARKVGILPFTEFIDAGGKLTMLLPDQKGLTEKLEQAHRELESFLLRKYHGTLAVTADYTIKAGTEDFCQENLKALMSKVGRQLDKSKNRKFSLALRGQSPVLDREAVYGGTCPACGQPSGQGTHCDNCKEEIRIGTELPHADYICFGDKGIELLPGSYLRLAYEPAGETYAFTLNEEQPDYPVWRINSYVPDINTFEDIAAAAVDEKGLGKPFLAYVKADVDDLGKIFTAGIPDERYSLSLYSTLSRAMNYFFNNYVYNLLKTCYPKAYSVISGGDDLFLILPWSQAVDFIEDLRRKFSRICCDYDDYHFSAGVAVAKANDPFTFVNQSAEHALNELAKEEKKKTGKAQVAYFDSIFDSEQFEAFMADRRAFSSFVSLEEDDRKPLTGSFVYRLFTYVSERLGSRKSQSLASYSRLRYDLARNVLDRKEQFEEGSAEKAASFILERFDKYNTKEDLKRFSVLLMDVMYRSRKSERMDY